MHNRPSTICLGHLKSLPILACDTEPLKQYDGNNVLNNIKIEISMEYNKDDDDETKKYSK